MKKTLLSLGLLATTAVPTLAVVSCSMAKKEVKKTEVNPTTSKISPEQSTSQKPSITNDKLQPTNPQPTNSQPTNKQPTNSQPANPQSTNSQPTNKQPTNKQPTNKQPTNKQPTNKQPTNKQPTNKQPANPQSTNSNPVNSQAKQPKSDVLNKLVETPPTNSPIGPVAGSSIKEMPTTAPSNVVVKSPEFKSLTDFKISDVTEDAFLPNFLSDIKHTDRTFRVYDNGLFKIKIEKKLIGLNCFYSSNEKADLQANDVAKKINIGPAVIHMSKGIQILYSSDIASLGGNLGLQISINNDNGSASDEGIKSETSLIAHEYGHHETLWDFENGAVGSKSKNWQDAFKDAFIKGLTDAGYPEIAKELKLSDESKGDLGFVNGIPRDFPSDYPGINLNFHKIFGDYNYPFDGPEIATRMLNILSFTSTLSPQEIYKVGGSGSFDNGYTFDAPTYLISDATIRHFTGDSVFGNGKDNSRVKDLIDFYMKDIFGLGSGSISISGDPNKGIINNINLDAFGTVDGLDSIEIQDTTGKVVASHHVRTFNSNFNFKKELISDKAPIKYSDPVKTMSDFSPNIAVKGHINLGFAFDNIQGYSIVGKDSNGKEVDISSLAIEEIRNQVNGNTQVFTGHTCLEVEGNHFVINPNA